MREEILSRLSQINEEEKRILVKVDYVMDVNYEHLADCKITIDIRDKDGQAFSLRN